ncbi:MAG: response regulator [Acidobacteriota bacterium]
MRVQPGEERPEAIRVLLADDEPAFRTSTALCLRRRGCEILEAGSAHDALRTLRLNPEIDVVILDHLMPGGAPAHTLAEIIALRPDLPVILLSGMGRPDPSGGTPPAAFFRYLEKPCDLDDLMDAIEAAARSRS